MGLEILDVRDHFSLCSPFDVSAMLNNPLVSTILVVLTGFLLSVVSLFVTDPYCRNVQSSKLRQAGEHQAQQVIHELKAKLVAITAAGKRFRRDEDFNEEHINQVVEELLQVEGVFSVEFARREDISKETTMQRIARGRHPGGVMKRARFPDTYRLVAVRSDQKDMSKFVGGERQYSIVRMVYQNGGTLISRPYGYYQGDKLRSGIATTLGSRDDVPLGLLSVTFDDLISPQSLHTELVSMRVSNIKLTPQALRTRSVAFEVKQADDRIFQAQQKIGGRFYRFSATEQPGAGFRPQWIKWSVFLLSNAIACLVGLSWLQRGRAELLRRNRELEHEVERRIALQKHLQATIDFRDHERELIAHEIHDGFVQDIIGAQMFAESTLAQTENDSPLRKKALAITDLLRNAIDEARKTIDYLKPRVVDEVGLVAALRDAVNDDRKNYNFETTLYCEEDLPRFPILVERMLYRIIREAISNARQHSGCDRATASLSVDAERIIAEVTDEGAGFDVSQVRSDSFGLPGIRQRIEMLNGTLELNTSEFGTKVTVEIPRDLDTPVMPPNTSLMIKI